MTFDRVRISTPLLLMVLLLSFFTPARAAEVIPPVPARYFNDDAHVVSPAVAAALNSQLEQFERDTSNQIRVVIYPKMQSDSDMAEYTTEVYHAWKIGQKGKDNGAVLFVFIAERRAQIITGYGLEGALPDAICKRIIDESVAPLLKTGNYDGAMQGAVAGMIAATRGEYQGTGKSKNEEVGIAGRMSLIGVIIAAFVGFGILLFLLHNFGGTFYQHHVRSLSFFENAYLMILQIAFSMIGSGGSSGSGGGGGGGYASSGGGDTGGGGAGGSW